MEWFFLNRLLAINMPKKTTQIIYLLPIKDKSGNEIISIKQIRVENDDFIDEIVRCSKLKYRSEYN